MSLFAIKWSTQPKAFGVFHIGGILFAILLGILGYYFGKKYSNDNYKRKTDAALSIIGASLIILEIIRQLFVVFVVCEGKYSIEYIPFQICDLASYMLCSIYFLKNKKIKNAFLGFVAFFSTGSALFYFTKPVAALNTEYIYLSINSFFWHAVLIGVGIFTIVSYSLCKKGGYKSLINGYYCWLICAVIALIVNETCNIIDPNTSINLFYINSKFETFYPLLSSIFNPYPRPYFIYFIAFCLYYALGGLLIYSLARLLDK